MITIVKKFHCSLCGFTTENKDKIEMIEKNQGKCPACQNRINNLYALDLNKKGTEI